MFVLYMSSSHTEQNLLSANGRIWLGRKRNARTPLEFTEINWVVITCASKACKYFRRRCFAYQNIWVSGMLSNPFFLTARCLCVAARFHLTWRVRCNKMRPLCVFVLQGPVREQHHLRSEGRPGRAGHSGGTVSSRIYS